MRNLVLIQNLYVNVYSNFVHNYQKWGRIQISFNCEWVKKLWSIYTMEQYSAIQVVESSIHMTNHKYIKLSERTQTQNTTYSVIPFMEQSGKGKMVRMENRSVFAGGGDIGKVDYQGAAQGQVMDLLCILIVLGVAQLYAFVKLLELCTKKGEFYRRQIYLKKKCKPSKASPLSSSFRTRAIFVFAHRLGLILRHNRDSVSKQ